MFFLYSFVILLLFKFSDNIILLNGGLCMYHEFEVLYKIYQNSEVSQRDLAGDLFISLGKVNQIIQSLVTQDMINHDSVYTVTKKGLDYLESHKVDNAIIMAAGFGSRFVPITYEMPKGLVTVNGEVLIERQILQLREAGIQEIIVVVGYLKEAFEYLVEKYGVKLVHNPDYAQKNNISTIFHVRDYLKNSYILTSDIYMPKNIYRKYEANSYYVTKFFPEDTTEWGVELNNKDLITKVNEDGVNNSWAMFGPVFFKKDFSDTLVPLVDSYMTKPSSDQWYWEHVYMTHIDQFTMYARKTEAGTVEEFESFEELRAFDKSYLTISQSHILDTICTVFDCLIEDIVEIKTLKVGMTNDSFSFVINGSKYVFRAPGKGSNLLINRKQEALVYEAIKSLRISDDVIYIDPTFGYKITKFIEGSRPFNHETPEDLLKSMALLKKFHDANLEVAHEFDLEERINHYLGLCITANAMFYQDFNEVYAQIKDVIAYVKSLKRDQTLCHIDSVSVNFIFDEKENAVLLDWEYAGMADPMTDLAMYVVYEGLDELGIDQLTDAYFKRGITSDERTILYAYIAMAGFLWSMWTQFKEASGDDFGTYGLEQYQYGRNYSKKTLERVEYAKSMA